MRFPNKMGKGEGSGKGGGGNGGIELFKTYTGIGGDGENRGVGSIQ
jgi:hypothetical protein